jgi:hypothetical protein
MDFAFVLHHLRLHFSDLWYFLGQARRNRSQDLVLGAHCPFTTGLNLPLMVAFDLSSGTSLPLVLLGTSFLNHAQISDHEVQFPLV